MTDKVALDMRRFDGVVGELNPTPITDQTAQRTSYVYGYYSVLTSFGAGAGGGGSGGTVGYATG